MDEEISIINTSTRNEKIKNFFINNKKIIPVEVYHHKLPVFGFRIGNFAYITDAKTIAKEELDKLKNLDVLIINALRIEPHLSHLNLEEAIAVIQQIRPKKAYLTHISHHMGFHDEVQATLPESIFLAYDQLEITL